MPAKMAYHDALVEKLLEAVEDAMMGGSPPDWSPQGTPPLLPRRRSSLRGQEHVVSRVPNSASEGGGAFKQYRRTAIAEMADWTPDFDMEGVSISEADREAGSPKPGDKIARNPVNHADRWLVAADYFAANFAPINAPATTEQTPKIVVFCGSSRFVDVMAVRAWEMERDEGAITMGLHLLPAWYTGVEDHIAEAEGVAEQMDRLHLRKIDLADEVFVINCGGYIGDSTRNEIAYATANEKPIRYLEPVPPSPDSAVPSGASRRET